MSKVVKARREKIIGYALIFIIILRTDELIFFFWDEATLCQKKIYLINQFMGKTYQ